MSLSYDAQAHHPLLEISSIESRWARGWGGLREGPYFIILIIHMLLHGLM